LHPFCFIFQPPANLTQFEAKINLQHEKRLKPSFSTILVAFDISRQFCMRMSKVVRIKDQLVLTCSWSKGCFVDAAYER
jgi:hypothetical protein